MKSFCLTGLAALLTLAGGAIPPNLFEFQSSRPAARQGAKQARQLIGRDGRYGQPLHNSSSLGTYHARGLKQRHRKERCTGATTARQQRKLQRVIRAANHAALINAFPASPGATQ